MISITGALEDQGAIETKRNPPKNASRSYKLRLRAMRGALIYGLNMAVLGALVGVMFIAAGLEFLSSKLEALE